MPSNPSGTGYRPVPMPFFVSDGNGGMRLDSAGSQANVNLQNLLLEQGRPKPTPEHIEHAERQKKVDAYIDAVGGEAPSYRPNRDMKFPLPRLASPQRLHTELYGDSKSTVFAKRSRQLEGLEGSVVGGFLKGSVYKDMDKTFAMIQERKEHIIDLKKQKRGMLDKITNKKIEFAQKDKDWIYEPLQESIDYFNATFKKADVPMKFVWRKTWETETSQKVDLWVIYANTPKTAERGPDAWMGSRDIVDPRNP